MMVSSMKVAPERAAAAVRGTAAGIMYALASSGAQAATRSLAGMALRFLIPPEWVEIVIQTTIL